MTDTDTPAAKAPAKRRSKRGRKGGRRAKSKTTPEAIATAELRGQVLQLRRQGWGYQAIGEALEFSAQRAHAILKEALAEIIEEPAKEVLDLELQRLEGMLLGVMEDAEKGDPRAIASALTIMERRAKLLGLDKPEKLDLTSGGKPLAPASNRPTVIQIVAVPARSNGDSGGKPEEAPPAAGGTAAA